MPTTWFVAAAGSDSNSGTILLPFATVSKAFSVLSAGDTVEVNGGDTISESPLLTGVGGVTVQSYGTGVGTIAGAGTTNTLSFKSCNGFTVQNLNVTNAGAVGTGWTSIYAELDTTSTSTAPTLVTDCSVSGGDGGIIMNCAAGPFVNVTVSNNTVTNIVNRGINFSSGSSYFSNLQVFGNVVSNIAGYNHAGVTGCGIVLENCNDFVAPCTAHHNHVFHTGYNCAGNGNEGPAAIFVINCINVTMHHNVCHDLFSSTDTHADGAGIDIDLTNTSCSSLYNFIYNADGCGLFFISAVGSGTHTIAHNICVNCARLSTDLDLGVISLSGAGTVLVYNNTIIGGAQAAVGCSSFIGVPNATLLNNCFCMPFGVPSVQLQTGLAGPGVMDGNYHQSGNGQFLAAVGSTQYTTLAAWRTATGYETNGVAAGHCYFQAPAPVPALTPTTLAGAIAYSPVAGSPLLNAGVSLLSHGITPKLDFLGNLWTQNTIGAIYNSAPPNPYATEVYSLNPIADLRLGESTGTTFLDSVPGFGAGTWANATLGQAVGAPGDGSTSVLFNGTSTFGSSPVSTHGPALSALSLHARFRFTNTTGIQEIINSKNTALASGFDFQLGYSGGMIFVVWDSLGNETLGSITFSFVANTWYDLIVTVGGTTLKSMTAYVNGSSVPIVVSPANTTTTMTVTQLGLGNTSSRFFSGDLVNVEMYPVVLTSGQAATLNSLASAVSYGLTGPATAQVGSASANLTLQPTSAVTDTITLSSSNGTLSHTSLSFATGAAQTFTATPASLGNVVITATSSNGMAITGSPFTFTAAVPFTVTMPGTIYTGQGATVTFTPSATTTDVVTPNDGNMGGTFTPSTLTFTASSAAQTVQYKSAVPGSITLGATSTHSAAFTTATTTSYVFAVDAWVSKWGLLNIYASTPGLFGNNNPVPAQIQAINSSPTWFVNGNALTAVDGPKLTAGQSYASWLPNCGGVSAINMVNGGTASYVTPKFTATTLNGCSGLVLANSGVGTTSSGLISYAITSAGTGYTTSFACYIPLSVQTPTVQACVWVTVVGGIVTSVVPLTGSPLAYGAGYTGTTITGIVLPGSSSFQYGSTDTEWELSSSQNIGIHIPGTGLTVTATVGNYPVPPAISTPGTGATAPVVFTITDIGASPTGAGATCVAVMTGPSNTDTVTYTTSSQWIRANCNGFNNQQTPAVSGASVHNSVGTVEGQIGRFPGYTGSTTMLAGINMGSSPTYYANNPIFMGKNRLKSSIPFQMGAGTTLITYDANYYPSLWTPGGWITGQFASFIGNQTNASAPGGPLLGNFGSKTLAQAQGTYTLQFDDDFYHPGGAINGAANPSFAIITTQGLSGQRQSISLVANGPGVAPVLGNPVLSGSSIGSIPITSGGSGLQAVFITVTGNGSNAAFVGTVTGGVLTSITKLNGGSGYSGTPTATATPVAQVSGVVTATYNIAFTATNLGGNLCLGLALVSNASGATQSQNHVGNPWVFGPGNTIDRSNKYATDDNVVANFSNGGNGIGVFRAMDSLGGPIAAHLIDVSDLMSPDYYSWMMYLNLNGTVPVGPPNSTGVNGTTSFGSPTVTGISSTAGLVVGQHIQGPGFSGGISAGTVTTIQSIDSSSQITLSQPAWNSGTQLLTQNPSQSGQITFNFARFYSTDPGMGTYSWASPHLYSSDLPNTSSDAFGNYLDISAGPNGVTDNGAYIAVTNNTNQTGILELRSNLPHGLKTGFNAGASTGGFNVPTLNFTATLNGTTTLTGISGLTAGTNLFVGMVVTGTGIPANTVVATVISGTSVTISNAATVSGSQSLSAFNAIIWNVSGPKTISGGGNSQTFIINTFWVTGPTTVAVYVEMIGAAASGTFQHPVALGGGAATTETQIIMFYELAAPTMSLPFEYLFSACKDCGAGACHLNVPWVRSPALLQHIGALAFQYLPSTTLLMVEMGNEHWQTGDAQSVENTWEGQMANLVRYYPNGTSIYPHYNASGSVVDFVTNGLSLGGGATGVDHAHCLRAANAHYWVAQGFIAAGGTLARVKCIYGGFYGSAGTVANIVSAVTTYSLPQDFMCVAPYVPTLSLGNANFPAGYAASASNGNWPVSAWNDAQRLYMLLGQQGQFSNMANELSGTSIRVIGYEGGLTANMVGAPFYDQVNQDAFYHESYRDMIYAHYVGVQNGHPNIANSGLVTYCYFSGYGNFPQGPTWKLADGISQPIGSSTNNQFVTPQGGSPGNGNPWGFYQTNVTPGLTAVNDFIGANSPSVTSISPSTGSTAGGTHVTITGSGFTGATAVDFGANAGTSLVVVSGTSITIVSPAGTGIVDVTVTTPSGTSATVAGDKFTYGCVVTGISPTNGPVAGGTPVTITGTGFTGATAVKFGTTSGTSLVVVSDTSITINSPAGTGVVDVTVVTPGSTSATSSADLFTFTSPSGPTVTGLSVSTGPQTGSTAVTITGTNFTGATAVKFGTTNGTSLVVVSSTSITIASPVGSVGTVDITVVTSAGTSPTSSADRFTYTAVAPAVSGISVTHGPISGGTAMTITGVRFTGATAVNFGLTPGTSLTVVSDTSITITSPAGSLGSVDITVVGPGGTSPTSSADVFTYTALLPAVTHLSVSRGPTTGGTSVTITGSGFTGATTVAFGTHAGNSLVVVSDTTVTIVSPAASVGGVDITVTAPNGTSSTTPADQFSYITTTSGGTRRWYPGLRRPSPRISV